MLVKRLAGNVEKRRKICLMRKNKRIIIQLSYIKPGNISFFINA